MSTATRKDVALVRVGTWAASTGVTKITREDLADCVAAYADQLVDRPVIKIGHDDNNVFNEVLSDGEPAYGWLGNVTLGDGSAARPDPDVLYADYVGMPARLAEVSDTAWRRRSVELAWGVTTSGGKKYRAVLTGVALLGIAKPAVKGLSDVLALYASGADEPGRMRLVQGDDVLELDMQALTAFAAAQQTHDDTASVPHGPDGTPEGERDNNGPQQAGTTDTGGTRMTIKKADVDQALAQAGDEDVTARLQELLKDVAPAAGKPEGTPDGTQGGATVTPIAGAAAEGQVAASAAPGTVVVSEAMWQETQTRLSELGEVANEVVKARRDSIVTTAFSEGRITGAERDEWRKALDRDEAGTVTLLSALQPRFNTVEHGAANAGTTELSEDDEKAYGEFVGSLGVTGL